MESMESIRELSSKSPSEGLGLATSAIGAICAFAIACRGADIFFFDCRDPEPLLGAAIGGAEGGGGAPPTMPKEAGADGTAAPVGLAGGLAGGTGACLGTGSRKPWS